MPKVVWLKIIFLLTLLTFISCTSLKYKYGPDRLPATTSEITVSKIEVSLKDQKIFANGIDSTFIHVKLFDKDGNQVTKILPNELYLASSEDIEAKPFSLKQGIYKAEIKPRLRSKDIQLQVEWLSRLTSSVVVLQTTMVPVKNSLKPNHYSYVESSFQGELNYSRGDTFPETMFEEFGIENTGDNAIVDATKNPYSQRIFNFEYLEQARQNIQLQVDDIPNETVSHGMHSIFMFFPRKVLPLAEFSGNELVVTLPNEEQMIFNSESKEIIGGVFTEGPIDYKAKDRFTRHYADLSYQGKGIVLRVNARGQSPELGQFENTKIDMNYGIKGSAEVLIMNGATGQRCRRPKSDFWEPIDVSPIQFKFPTDEEFDQYLKAKCGFGLPKS